MGVLRVVKNRNYTVMSNYHLQDTRLSLKAKGLLSVILSLPDDWNYTTRGLASICKEGVGSIGTTLKELENAKYILRNRLRNEKGIITDMEYVIYEVPQNSDNAKPNLNNPHIENPHTENPYVDNQDMDDADADTPNVDEQYMENDAQLNTNILKNNKSNTVLLNTNISNPILSNPKTDAERIGLDAYETYTKIIKENIEYDIMAINYSTDIHMLDEIVELMIETVCTSKEYLTIAGDDYPSSLVKSKFLKLTSEHIEYVMDCMKQNTSDVRNIKKYLLAVLFNALTTIDSYYASKVNHDMHGGGYE